MTELPPTHRPEMHLFTIGDKPTRSRQVQIILSAPEEIARSIGDFICSTKKGVATISLTTPVKQEVLEANQARLLRLLSLDPVVRFAWKQRRSHDEAQDKAGLALSLQLSSLLHQSLSLNMIVGLHLARSMSCTLNSSLNPGHGISATNGMTFDSAHAIQGRLGDPDIQARLIAVYESLQEQQLQMVVQKQFHKYMPRNTLALSVERDKPTRS